MIQQKRSILAVTMCARTLQAGVVALAVLAGTSAVFAQARRPAPAAAPQADPAKDKWESRVRFFGEEETNLISLRILDRDAVEEGNFALRSLWKFDAKAGKWVEMDVQKQNYRIRTKDKKPDGSPPDSQVLADLGIKVQDVGLYYAHWSVDDVKGSTYLRLGPTADKKNRTLPAAPKAGEKAEDVPLTIDEAKFMVIPDPMFHTGPDCPPIPK